MTDLRRDLKRWAGMVPSTVADGSDAQVVFALADAKHDIAVLAARVSEIERDRECAVAALSATVERLERDLADAEVEITAAEQHRAAADAARDKAQAEAEGLREAWQEARKALPPDPDLNKPWSLALAIMDEALAAITPASPSPVATSGAMVLAEDVDYVERTMAAMEAEDWRVTWTGRR